MGRTGGDHGSGNFFGQGFVLHQGRSGPFVAHLLGRAAHVDVNDLRPALDVEHRCLGHHGGIGAGNLHGNRPGFARMVGAAAGFQAFPQILARGDHFADGVTCAQAFAQLAKGRSVTPAMGATNSALASVYGPNCKEDMRLKKGKKKKPATPVAGKHSQNVKEGYCSCSFFGQPLAVKNSSAQHAFLPSLRHLHLLPLWMLGFPPFCTGWPCLNLA